MNSQIKGKASNLLEGVSPTLIAVIVVVFLWSMMIKRMWLQIYDYTMDDSFITYRYAQNLIDGAIEWNRGEDPEVEGYTSILWVLIATFIQLMGLDVVASSKLISTGLVLASLALIVFFIPTHNRRWFALSAAAIAPALFLINTDLVVHMLSGMETALAIFLSTGFFVAITVLNRKLTSNAIFPTFLGLVLSLIGLLSSLNRPEFNVAFATSGLALIALNMNHRTQILKLIVLPYLSIGACYLAWRIYYYGLILPLPFYIKVAPATLAGISDVKLFFLKISPLLPWVLITLFSAETRHTLAPALLGLLSLCFFFIFPAHTMNVGNRFMAPLYGALCFIAVIGIVQALGWKTTWTWRVVVISCVLMTIMGVHRLNDKGLAHEMQSYSDGLTKAHIKLGKALSAYGEKHTIAMGDAGAISFFSKWKVVDTFGLNNRSIALTRAQRQYDARLIINEEPEVLVFISTACNKIKPPEDVSYEKQILDLALTVGYHQSGIIEFMPDYFLFLYMRQTEFTHRLEADLEKDIYSKCTYNNSSA